MITGGNDAVIRSTPSACLIITELPAWSDVDAMRPGAQQHLRSDETREKVVHTLTSRDLNRQRRGALEQPTQVQNKDSAYDKDVACLFQWRVRVLWPILVDIQNPEYH